jgi:hypothetical protein
LIQPGGAVPIEALPGSIAVMQRQVHEGQYHIIYFILIVFHPFLPMALIAAVTFTATADLLMSQRPIRRSSLIAFYLLLATCHLLLTTSFAAMGGRPST